MIVLPEILLKCYNMKKISVIFALISFINVFSQNINKSCGFDEVMRKMNSKYPSLEKSREDVDARFAGLNVQSYLNKVGATTSWEGLYTGQIYEIPVVVHVIESSAAANSNLHLTDQEIINWIGRANSMYATTYGNGFYPEGSGPTGGAVIPFRLVLAKRSPSCAPTTGIVRYNGSTLPGYDSYGVAMQSSNGTADYLIKTQIAPHWPENSYFNIYVVIGFDGQQQLSYGLMGYAKFPDSYDFDYESFMKVATIKNQNDTTLTHELGHAFGLYHTFQGVSYTSQTTCPSNTNCTTDGDRVCDTSPSRSMYGVAVPGNTSIDPCTGVNYDGTQYNIMNYTNVERKFTDGQRDRAVLMMMEYRKNLLNSLGGTDPSVTITSPVSVIAAQCNPAGILNPTNNNFAIGPYRVVMGSINNMSTGYDSDEVSPVYYADYTNATCIRPAYFTDISTSTSSPLKISYLNGFSQANKFRTKVWIDYNNNGTFETTELVVNNVSTSPVSASTSVTLTNNIMAPASAIKNTYLRMRVAVDAATYDWVDLPDFGPCTQLQYGQMEDYAVRVLDVLGTSEVKESAETKIVYLKADNKLKLVGRNEIFGDYQLLDMSGKLIQKGNSKTDEIQINQQLPKGVYIVTYSNSSKANSQKFINN